MPQICSHSRTILDLPLNYVYVVITVLRSRQQSLHYLRQMDKKILKKDSEFCASSRRKT
jgi:hypothetical protein